MAVILATTFHHLHTSRRFIELQGGTRSAKTYSVLQYLALRALKEILTIDIFRRYGRTHIESTLPDFRRILNELDIKSTYNATTKSFIIGRSIVRFIGADDIEKLRGPQRDIAFINEATELTKDQFDEINQRTKERVILDFNPWAKSHWVYTLPDLYPSKVAFFKSTYRDNPALSPGQIETIEAYAINDPAKWQIYGLGNRIIPEELIYAHATTCTVVPEGESVVGVDFGSSSPTAAVKVTRAGDAYYWQELIYERNLPTGELITRLAEMVGKRTRIYCDAAEPDRIREMVSAGLQAMPAIKSIQAGVGFVKSYRLLHHYDASGDPIIGENLLKEMDSYSWVRNRQTGIITDEPVKQNDHLMDAGRYAAYTHWGAYGKSDHVSAGNTAIPNDPRLTTFF